MDDAEDQQQPELSVRDLEADEVAVQDAVGDEDKRRDEQLHERAVVGGDVAELLVAEDDAAVEHGRQQAEQDALRFARCGQAAVGHAGDKHHADERHGNVEQFSRGELFVHQDRCTEDDDDRVEVGAERCDGDGRIAIGLEQRHPVEAQQDARDQQRTPVAPDGGEVDLLPLDGEQKEEKERADAAAREGHERRGLACIADEHAERAVDQDRRQKGEFCGFGVGHGKVSVGNLQG